MCVLFVPELRMPRWLARSVQRHRMWRLSDQTVDDVLDEELRRITLPSASSCATPERSISQLSSMTRVKLDAFERAMRACTPAVRQRARPFKAMSGLSAAAEAHRAQHRERLLHLQTSSVLLGPCGSGLPTCLFLPPIVLRDLRRARAAHARDLEAALRHAAAVATEKASTQTGLGRRSRTALDREAHLVGVA